MPISERDRENLAKLAKRIGGENAQMLLTVLGREKQFIDAITSPLGEELMKDALTSLEARMALVIDEKDEPKDRAEIRILKEIIRKWQKKINKYEQNKEKLMKALK